MKVSVVNLPNNLDPDDYVNRFGADKYLEYINQNQKVTKNICMNLIFKKQISIISNP